jgi:chemotaxis protein methyltransferase CheR
MNPGTRPAAPLRAPSTPRVAFEATVAADDFTVLCEKVRQICGVDLLQYKRGQMERRVRTWVQRRGAASLPVYADLLRRDPDELDAFLDRVTINVSHLWRHEEQWEALRKDILPGVAAASGRIRAWSAGSSYGAEAYTLAAICTEAAPRASISITGTDLDRRMVARARTGVFTAEDARVAPRALMRKHFEPTEDGGWRASTALRGAVRFEQGDLLRMRVPRERYDLVMCRNTVIYFTEEVRDTLHQRLVESLAPGGYLVVGTSERVANPRELGLSSTHHFIYRKS